MPTPAAQAPTPLTRTVRRSALAFLACLLALPAVRCGGEPTEPSVGRCVGSIGAASFDLTLDAYSAYYVRYSSGGGSPADVLSLSYGDAQLRMSGRVGRERYSRQSGELPIPPEQPPCEDDPRDAGADAGVPDGGASDGGDSDAGEPDAGEADAGDTDAGEPDGGALDAGEPDAGGPRLPACAPSWKRIATPVHAWSVSSPRPDARPRLVGGTYEAALPAEERLVGTFELSFEDGTTLACTFDLAHDEELDQGEPPGGCGGGSSSGGGGGFDD